MTWLGCFRLAYPDLAGDHHPNSNTYKSHRYTLGLKQCKYSATVTAYTYPLFYILTLKHKHNWYSHLYIHTSSNFILVS
jgi:hypothetical protein